MVTQTISIISPNGATTWSSNSYWNNMETSPLYQSSHDLTGKTVGGKNYDMGQYDKGIPTSITVEGKIDTFVALEAMKDANETWNQQTAKYTKIKLEYGAGGPSGVIYSGMIKEWALRPDPVQKPEGSSFTLTIKLGAAKSKF